MVLGTIEINRSHGHTDKKKYIDKNKPKKKNHQKNPEILLRIGCSCRVQRIDELTVEQQTPLFFQPLL